MSIKLSTLDQNKTNGQLSVLELKNIDMNPINGLWVPCAASLSPWNTHLSSEEYEPDARSVEEKPAIAAINAVSIFKIFALSEGALLTIVMDQWLQLFGGD